MDDLKFTFDVVPEPIYDARPDFLTLYRKAWELAADHIDDTIPGLPVVRHMDEACRRDRLWIWDTCFMVHFCKYSPKVFPGIESLDNFYYPMHDGFKSSCLIHHPDNPPLFAWIEYEYYRFTGDKSRIYRNLVEKKFLQKHYDFLENQCKIGTVIPNCAIHTAWQKFENGYVWGGNPSGMDNSPRANDQHYMIYWVDAISQQALSALYISKLADEIGEEQISRDYMAKYLEKKEIINKYYFDEEKGYYLDIEIYNLKPFDVLTPASFWVMMAEAATAERAARQIKTLTNPMQLGGVVPAPTVARNNPNFIADGRYWRGGVWLPTSYMVAKSLEKYGYYDQAASFSEATVNHMSKTYQEFFPQTIWECYSPTEHAPAKSKFPVKYSRPDFCGWSALGPISMLIENVLGFHRADAVSKRLEYHHRPDIGRHGIRNFKFGEVCCDVIVNNKVAEIVANTAFTFVADGVEHSCTAGKNIIKL